MPESNRLSEVDHLRLQLLVERSARLRAQAQLAQHAVVNADLVLEQLQNEIRASYKLEAGDACDRDSGVITRAPQPEKKAEPAP